MGRWRDEETIGGALALAAEAAQRRRQASIEPNYQGLRRLHLLVRIDLPRQARVCLREEILSTTVADIRTFAEAMADVAANGLVVVLGSEQAIETANSERPGLLTISRVL